MPFVIRPWAETEIARLMQPGLRPDLIIGNGASIALHPGFRYENLREQARRADADGAAARVLAALNTDDFELALHATMQARRVLQALGEDVAVVERAAVNVRDALIRAVRNSHPNDAQAEDLAHGQRIRRAANFARKFRLIFNMNYDVVLYRGLLGAQLNLEPPHRFDDGFRWEGLFDADAFEPSNTSTELFYPHGSLALGRRADGSEVKIRRRGELALLESVLDHWTRGDVLPLFVCEGESPQKRAAIARSSYLSYVSQVALPCVGEHLVIYGWGIGPQDVHILDAIGPKRRPHCRVSVSVFDGMLEEEKQDHCHRVKRMLRRVSVNPPSVEFFSSGSAGCWCNTAT